MKLRLSKIQEEVADIKTFVFTPQEPVNWLSGQYIHCTLPHTPADDRGDERWFTISSAPFEHNISFTTRIFDAPSTFKMHLLELKVGEVIETEEPEGDFVVTDKFANYVFVAGGIGITPFRSILSAMKNEGSSLNVELLYANRGSESIIFKDELEALAAEYSTFNIEYFIGDIQIDEKTLARYNDKLNSPIFMLSGPEPMVKAFDDTLRSIGVDDAHRMRDNFPGYEGI